MEQFDQLLNQLEEVVMTAKKSLFSGNDIVLNRNQILDILDRIRANYPDVIKEAQYLTSECDAQRQKAIEYGAHIVEEAEQRQRRLIDESEILKKATEEAEEIRTEAYALRDRVEYDVKTKVDNLLQDSEVTLRDALSLIRTNREELRDSMPSNNNKTN
ncbi:MAG: hypothetical protein RSB20_05635 [Clostridia bacterium]